MTTRVQQLSTGRYLTIKTAIKHGLLTNPQAFAAEPGTYISLAPNAHRRSIAKKSAQKLLKEGQPVLLPAGERFVPRADRILNSFDRVELPIPNDIDAADKLALTRLKRQMAIKKLPSWERVEKYYQLEQEIIARYGYKKGQTYTVVVDAILIWNRIDTHGYAFQLTKDKTIVEQVLCPRNIRSREQANQILGVLACEQFILNKYKGNSPPEYRISNVSSITQNNTPLADIPMGSIWMPYVNIGNEVRDSGKHQCVIDYILWEGQRPDTRVQNEWTRSYLIRELGERPTTNQIIKWAKDQEFVSVYALTPILEVFGKHVAKKCRVSLFFVVNNKHCYAITDPTQRIKITHSDKLVLCDFADLQKKLQGEYEYIDVDENEESDIQAKQVADRLEETNKELAIVNISSLHRIAAAVMKQTSKLIESIKGNDGIISTFKYPTKELIVVAGKDFNERKQISNDVFEKNRLQDFKFANQSWGVIGKMLLESFYNKLPVSHYSPDFQQILEEYAMIPYRSKEAEVSDDSVAIDIRRCYSSILKDKRFKWYVLNGFESVKPFDGGDISPGEYYLSRTVMIGRNSIKVSRGFYPSNLIEVLLAKGYITKSDITYMLRASGFVANNIFSEFVDKVHKQYPLHSKEIINMLIGVLGILHKKQYKAAATCDMDTAIALAAEITSKGNKADIHYMKDFIRDEDGKYHHRAEHDFQIVSEIIRTTLSEGYMPFYRQVIAESIVKLDKLCDDICNDKTIILGYNTDCIKIRGSYNKDKIKEKSACEWGDYHIEKEGTEVVVSGYSAADHDERPVWRRKAAQINEYIADNEIQETGVIITAGSAPQKKMTRREYAKHILSSKGGLILGEGGSGKSWILAEICKTIDYCGIAFTHKACQNLREKDITMQTLCALLYNHKTGKNDISKLEGLKALVIDEVFMIPPEMMRLIMAAKIQFGFIVIAAGDYNQSAAISPIKIKYHEDASVLNMFGNNIVHCKYIEGAARYDVPLHDALTSLLKTHMIPQTIQVSDKLHERNICATNQVRRNVNKLMREEMAEKVGKKLVQVNSGENDLAIFAGMKLMAYHNTDFEHNVFKTEEVDVIAIDEDEQTVILRKENGDEFDISFSNLAKIYDNVYCTTVHKYQGGVINEPFLILEPNRMSLNVLYTAMSRGTKINDVRIFGKNTVVGACVYESNVYKMYHPAEKYEDFTVCREIITSIHKKHGFIYKIVCEDGCIYIGKTERTVEERFAEHLIKPAAELAKHLTQCAYVEVIDEFDFVDDAVLDDAETSQIHAHESDKLLNTMKRLKPEKEATAKQPKRRIKEFKPYYETKNKRWCVLHQGKRTRFADGNNGGKDKSLQAAAEYCKKLEDEYR